jgi:ribosomal protein S18 acetylase RimI-like enzyme
MGSSDGPEISTGIISLRPAAAGDNDFLMQVYASTRHEEMALWGWNPAQQKAFIQMQYDARRRGYAAAHPSAETSIILQGKSPAGSMIVFRGPGEIRLLDISLLSEFRGRGIGRELITMLISEAARSGAVVRLSVVRGNPAARLYERLGFVATGGDAIYCEMECLPK